MAQIEASPLTLPDGANEALAAEGRVEKLAGVSVAIGHKAARMAFVAKPPETGADDAAINEWADKRVLANLPQAILEKEFQLHYGDDDQRDKAADSFLKMNGRHEKEGQVSGGALIVIHAAAGGLQLPYAPKHLTIEQGEVIDAKK